MTVVTRAGGMGRAGEGRGGHEEREDTHFDHIFSVFSTRPPSFG